MGAFIENLKREFSITAMRERANRKGALSAARWDLEQWADYGDAALLESAIETLRSAREAR